MISRILAALLLFGTPALASELSKADPYSPVFSKTSGAAVSVKAGTTFAAGGFECEFTADTAVSMPTLVGGTDYQIRVEPDCDIVALPYESAGAEGSVRIGGFHFLPGGYADGYDTGGDTIATVLHWSFWDLNYRPDCRDPRGMTKVGNSPVWIDIYFQGDAANADGVSRNNQPILSGSNPPVRAIDYGGNGTAKYQSLNWWEANEFLAQWGKRLPTYAEMTRAAFGAKEGKGRGNHPVSTGLNTTNASVNWWDKFFTSKFGLIQAVGVIWIWTADLSDWEGTAAPSPGWFAYDVTGSRGKLILQNTDDLTALLFGGKWFYESENGSRTAEVIEKLWDSSLNLGMRGACDHYTLH